MRPAASFEARLPEHRPLYNFGAPSGVKAWVDHIIVTGHSVHPETQEGLIGELWAPVTV